MKRMIVVALAVLGVCMAVTASASAHLFHASTTGKLLGNVFNGSIQKFVPFEKAGTVECNKATTTGTVTALLALHQEVTVVYSECTAFTFVNVDISPAKYLLSADGLAAIVNSIFINVLGICTLTVKPQDLGTVKYDSDGTNLIELSEVKGIKSEGAPSGSSCGTATNTGGTYTGNNLIILDPPGSTISWL